MPAYTPQRHLCVLVQIKLVTSVNPSFLYHSSKEKIASALFFFATAATSASNKVLCLLLATGLKYCTAVLSVSSLTGSTGNLFSLIRSAICAAKCGLLSFLCNVVVASVIAVAGYNIFASSRTNFSNIANAFSACASSLLKSAINPSASTITVFIGVYLQHPRSYKNRAVRINQPVRFRF